MPNPGTKDNASGGKQKLSLNGLKENTDVFIKIAQERNKLIPESINVRPALQVKLLMMKELVIEE